jgi:hypothetical protein
MKSRTSKEGKFLLEIEINGGAKVWRGIITPDALTAETDEDPVYRCTLTAVCGARSSEKSAVPECRNALYRRVSD